MARPRKRTFDTKQWIPLFAALICLTLYFLPLWVLYYVILASGFFYKESHLIEPLANYLSSWGPTFENILRVVTGILVGGGISYLSMKKAKTPEKVSYLTVLGYVGLALVLLWVGHFIIELNIENLREGYPESVANSIQNWTLRRLEETLTLFALLLGLKGPEFLASRSGGNTK